MSEALGARIVPVELGARAYDVAIGAGLLAELGPRSAEVVAGRRAFLVTDAGVPGDVVERATDSLRASGFEVLTSEVNALESNKTIDTVGRLLHRVAEARHDRSDPVIALGGGIVGDIAGFVAASYRRGVPFIPCPTTLLAMVDASVGGKTGANLTTSTGLKKNLVGAFWQPALVLADVAALASLPKRYLRAGLAECVKHGIIAGSAPGRPAGPAGELFAWTSDNLVKLRMGDEGLMADLVERNVRVKAAVVAADEREEDLTEAGGRALLNLGHTFGHAIETIPSLSPDGDPDHAPLQHGEAVAFGLVAAAGAAQALGLIDGETVRAIRVGVERLGLESRLMGLPEDAALLEVMLHDKKVRSGRLRIVAPTGLGTARTVDDPPVAALAAGWDAIRVGRS